MVKLAANNFIQFSKLSFCAISCMGIDKNLENVINDCVDFIENAQIDNLIEIVLYLLLLYPTIKKIIIIYQFKKIIK